MFMETKDKKIDSFAAVPLKFIKTGIALNGSAWRVFLYLLSCDYKHIKTGMTKDGKILLARKERVFVSQDTIVRELSMPLRTVTRAISLLKEIKFIETKRRFNTSNETSIKY